METTLIKLLRDNNDVFAWQPEDMKGIDPNFVYHRLETNRDYLPVAQRKRKLGEEKEEAVKQETSKLCKAKFIPEVKYPTWLANSILIEKPNRKWRMCVDYTDLNKPDTQILAGWVGALSRFLSRLTHKSHPFFQLLRKIAQLE